MNWEAIGAIGEVVGAVGVILTLVYLAIQIRQNTASLKATALQSMLEASAGLHDMCASDAELSRIFLTGMNGSSPSSPEDEMRFHFLMMSFLRRLENIYHQGNSGQVADADWEGVKRSSLAVLARPGAQEWWTRERMRFSDDFVAWISREIPPGQSADPAGGA